MQSLEILTQRFVDDWRVNPFAALKRIAESLSWKLYPPRARFARTLERERRLAQEFDRQYRVETAREVPLSEVGIEPGSAARGNGIYRGIWPDLFHASMSALTFDLRPFTFLDYGSGKGKAMLLASDYPFRRIIGVEYSRSLHDVSEANFRTFTSDTQQCRDFQSICVDATTYEPPLEPLVCFFFNPFDDAITRAVLSRLHGSVRRSPRPVYLLYVNVRSVRERVDVFTRAPGLTVVARQKHFLLMKLD